MSEVASMPHHPLRIAHRGASREHRENTLPAFRRAIELGADAIELDVHVTSDGVVVVHHDFDVAAGNARLPIAQSTFRDLRAVDLGGQLQVPSLDEVFELVSGRVELLVELKGAAIETAVLDGLRRHHGPYAVHSFDHAAIERVAGRWPAVRRGLLFDAPPVALAASVARAAARDVWPRLDVATAGLIDAAHALGLRVIAWTVNDPAHGAILVERGVDGICTDDIRALRRRE